MTETEHMVQSAGTDRMPEDTIKSCVDRVLPPDLRVEAAIRAMEEEPANTPILRVAESELGFDPSPAELAVFVGKKWQNGKTLRVCFLDGLAEVQAKVEEYAHKWSQYAGIKFEFGSDTDAEIRISFQGKGSWSWVGTDALSIGRDRPTMNLGWLAPNTPEDEYSRVVLHEFGHTLGFIHEHQQPGAGIPWDKEVVYRYYMGPPNNWTREQVDVNIFQKYSASLTNFSTFDRESIMLYPIPEEFTVGDYQVGLNKQLSAMDREFIGAVYPLDGKPTTELSIDGQDTKAYIGKHGEEDLFRFVVTAEGDYTIRTKGRTDVVMKLFGPNDLGHLIAEDDDSGRAYNATIVKWLTPGTYFARIRHYKPTGTGKYKISVLQRSS